MVRVIDAALSRSRTTVVLLLLLLTVGSFSYFSIPKESDPDIPIPYVSVEIEHDGISPEDAERMLLRPMEQALQGLDGLKEMRGIAAEGYASLSLEFQLDIDQKQALADVRDKVDLAKAKLPAGTEDPMVHEITLAAWDPVVTIVLSGAAPERALILLARQLRDKLQNLKEVLEVEIGGDRDEVVEVSVNPLLMESYGLEPESIFTLLSRSNRLVAAGVMDNGKGRFPIKVPSVFESMTDILTLPVKVDGDRVITLGDIAQIRRTFTDPTSFTRLNGKPAITLEVKKRAGENAIETVNKVRDIVTEAATMWPVNVQVDLTGDASEEIKDMLTDLQNNVASAVVLVVIVIIAILGIRSAALVGIAIPGSFLTGIWVLSACGMTMNTVVLFGLIMAVGMLVDGAIVVTEFADREMSEGMHRKAAYQLAANRMAWPIIVSTATTLAAFAPLLFWPGMMGEYMKYLPLTLIFTLSASLVMALIFVPTLGTLFGKPRPVTPVSKAQFIEAEQGEMTKLKGLTGLYVRALKRAIHRPWFSLVTALVFSVVVLAGYGVFGKGLEFFPDIDTGSFEITVRSQGNLSILEKDAVMKEVEMQLLGMEGVQTLYAKTGGEDEVGYIRGNLTDWQGRRHVDELIAEVLQRTDHLAGIELEVRQDDSGPASGKAVQYEISSRDSALLQQALAKVRAAFEQHPALTNVSDNHNKPGMEWQIEVNREKAARFGADTTLVGESVQLVTTGLEIGSYRPDESDDEIEIKVRFPEAYRHIDSLQQLRLKTSNGQVPMSNFTELKATRKQGVINKVDSRRVITLAADLAPGYRLNDVLPDMMARITALGLDPRVELTLRGENEEQEESEIFLLQAFAVALAVMTLILITQFNSFYQAFLILSAVLFSTVGVFLGLLVTQQAFGVVMGGLGAISLAGIVVNNNIVLIDTFNSLCRAGVAPMEAILRTGAQRLRPVLMTTMTTILGLMPMVLEMNLDFFHRNIEFGAPVSKLWVQLASAVVGGLSFATLLTLILTPCMLALRINRKDRPSQSPVALVAQAAEPGVVSHLGVGK
ncbi:efflux RND transporter permease subunit [Photobacterium sp. TY1-4]|uniref:efflux RND transporter permease subunit n=1 Tax=Photobacterium sp. TY1-4 TaxID=2899122 RepID=UPI0021C20AC6|nr:efflux RND transporter permease subunit [Photobacterium sp. TY1-4]UXI02178.1 efflux RND transporter permease subunit [Photobacterium sp. TY1-4]